MPVHAPKTWLTDHQRSSYSVWPEPPILLDNLKLGGQGTKGGKVLALLFLAPTHMQVVVGLTFRSANSKVRACSIHSSATGYNSQLSNVRKSLPELTYLLQGRPYEVLQLSSYLLPRQGLVMKTQANHQCNF